MAAIEVVVADVVAGRDAGDDEFEDDAEGSATLKVGTGEVLLDSRGADDAKTLSVGTGGSLVEATTVPIGLDVESSGQASAIHNH